MRRLLFAIKTAELENERLFMVKTRVKMQRRGGIFFDGVIPVKTTCKLILTYATYKNIELILLTRLIAQLFH